MKRVLVTGANGHTGSNLVRMLLERGVDAVLVEPHQPVVVRHLPEQVGGARLHAVVPDAQRGLDAVELAAVPVAAGRAREREELRAALDRRVHAGRRPDEAALAGEVAEDAQQEVERPVVRRARSRTTCCRCSTR